MIEKSQLDTIPRSMDCGVLSHNRYIYITVPAYTAQGTSWKRAQKDYKSQKYQEVCRETVLPTNVCINKTRAIIGHANM